MCLPQALVRIVAWTVCAVQWDAEVSVALGSLAACEAAEHFTFVKAGVWLCTGTREGQLADAAAAAQDRRSLHGRTWQRRIRRPGARRRGP